MYKNLTRFTVSNEPSLSEPSPPCYNYTYLLQFSIQDNQLRKQLKIPWQTPLLQKQIEFAFLHLLRQFLQVLLYRWILHLGVIEPHFYRKSGIKKKKHISNFDPIENQSRLYGYRGLLCEASSGHLRQKKCMNSRSNKQANKQFNRNYLKTY